MTRKNFLKIFLSALAIPMIYLFDGIVSNKKKMLLKKIKLPGNIVNGLTLYSDLIISKKGELLKVFSSECTHLGCSINRVSNDKIYCPCHGSEYDLDGNVIKGPSNKNLIQLEVKIDQKTGDKFVNVPG